jgi:hypothetical protein
MENTQTTAKTQTAIAPELETSLKPRSVFPAIPAGIEWPECTGHVLFSVKDWIQSGTVIKIDQYGNKF